MDKELIIEKLKQNKLVKMERLATMKKDSPNYVTIDESVLTEEIADIDYLLKEEVSQESINRIVYSTTSNYVYDLLKEYATENPFKVSDRKGD